MVLVETRVYLFVCRGQSVEIQARRVFALTLLDVLAGLFLKFRHSCRKDREDVTLLDPVMHIQIWEEVRISF